MGRRLEFTRLKSHLASGGLTNTYALPDGVGHGPKSVGAICDPTAFSGVVEVPPGVLGPHDGTVVVDLVEPGCEPLSLMLTRSFERRSFVT